MIQEDDKTVVSFQNTEENNRKKRKEKKSTYELLAFFIPFIILLVFIGYFMVYKNIITNYSFVDDLFVTMTFPELLWSYLVKIALMLVIGIPIGFFSRKKISFIHYGIYSAFICVFRFLIGYFRFENNNSIPIIIYAVIDTLILAGLLLLGVLIGKLFGKDYWIENKRVKKLESN